MGVSNHRNMDHHVANNDCDTTGRISVAKAHVDPTKHARLLGELQCMFPNEATHEGDINIIKSALEHVCPHRLLSRPPRPRLPDGATMRVVTRHLDQL
jgi:hypothetical protein